MWVIEIADGVDIARAQMATVDEAPTATATTETETVAWYALAPEEVTARQGVDPQRGWARAASREREPRSDRGPELDGRETRVCGRGDVLRAEP